MDAKIAGEDTLRRLYAAPSVVEQSLGYTVVRPGGLTAGESLGVSVSPRPRRAWDHTAADQAASVRDSSSGARTASLLRVTTFLFSHWPPDGCAQAVELNQGDNKSGRIARADVAAICVESVESAAAFDTTFECYYADTAKGLDDVMQSNAKAVGAGIATEATSFASGLERRADSWPRLFEGLRRDVA
eukprot:5250866-Prymnesium_polylepis.1